MDTELGMGVKCQQDDLSSVCLRASRLTSLSLGFLLGKMGTAEPKLLPISSYCRMFSVCREQTTVVQGAELEPDMETGPGMSCWTARSFSFLIREMECGRMRHSAQCSETTQEGVGRVVLGSEEPVIPGRLSRGGVLRCWVRRQVALGQRQK